jgi:predicted transcriptional regulator
MQSGLISRLNELGLIRREKRGKNIWYHVTSRGLKYAESMRTTATEKFFVTQKE